MSAMMRTWLAMLGRAIIEGDMRRCGVILGIIGCFFAGAAAGTMLAQWTGRRHWAAVGFLVAVLLAANAVVPAWETAFMVLALGTLNASMTQVGQASVSLTYVTGTLVKVGQGIGKAMCGKGQGFSWALQGAMWLFLLAQERVMRGEPPPARFTVEEAAGLGVSELMRDDGRIVGADFLSPQPPVRPTVSPALAAACLSLVEADVRTDAHVPQVISVGLPFWFSSLPPARYCAGRGPIDRTAGPQNTQSPSTGWSDPWT